MKMFRAVIAAAIWSSALSLHAQAVDGIEVVVHDSVVTRYEVETFAAPLAKQLARQYASQPDVFEHEYAKVRNEGRQKLLEDQLILRDYVASGYSLPESVIDDAVQEEIDRVGGRTKLTKTLQAEGMTFEKFRRQIRDNYIVRALRSKNISSLIIISPHKIESYYLAHQDDFKLEDQVKLRMIVLNKPAGADAASVRKRAEEIRAKITEGVPFAEMAQVNSEGTQRSQGGDWGWVERKVLRPELGDVAFKLKPGAMSDVIETPEACYLMLVEEKRTAHVKPLSEVQDEIERTLLDREQSRLQKQYLDRLRKKTFIRYF
jgi:parvulin-like peptidyl-prolyl isomerase